MQIYLVSPHRQSHQSFGTVEVWIFNIASSWLLGLRNPGLGKEKYSARW
jgi:hypothetical protein